MKNSTVLLIVFMHFSIEKSYSQAFRPDTKIIAAGFGLGSSLGGFNYSSQIPALSIQYEQGMWKAGEVGIISLGGYLGYKSFSYETISGNFEAKSKWNYTIVGVRSAFHYTGIENDKLDLFGGLMLSYNILNYSYNDNTGITNPVDGSFGSSAGLTLYVGGRYYLNEKMGLFAEAGYGVSYLNLGLVWKL